MAKVNFPEKNNQVMPYLVLNDAEGFKKFMQEVFDAELTYETNGGGERIMHAQVMLGESTIMFANASEEWKAQPAGMFIYVDDADARHAKALEAGATSLMGLSDQSYGRTCGVTDPFGNTWWITSVTN